MRVSAAVCDDDGDVVTITGCSRSTSSLAKGAIVDAGEVSLLWRNGACFYGTRISVQWSLQMTYAARV